MNGGMASWCICRSDPLAEALTQFDSVLDAAFANSREPKKIDPIPKLWICRENVLKAYERAIQAKKNPRDPDRIWLQGRHTRFLEASKRSIELFQYPDVNQDSTITQQLGNRILVGDSCQTHETPIDHLRNRILEV